MERMTTSDWNSKESINNLFSQNLNFFVEEDTLQKQNMNLKMYYDTSVIEEIVVGLLRYVKIDHSINLDGLQSHKELTNNILYQGKLGDLHMLAPHQEEFLYRLENRKDKYIKEYPQNLKHRIIEFLEKTGISEKFERISEQNINETEVPDLIKARELAVKLNYLLEDTTWQKRLNKILKNNVLIFEEPSLDYTQIITSRLFSEIEKRLTEERGPNKSRNNFTDALALSELHERFKLFEEGKLKYLPIFFDFNGGLTKVVNHKSLKRYFEYSPTKDVTLPLVRDSSFLIWKFWNYSHTGKRQIFTHENIRLFREKTSNIKIRETIDNNLNYRLLDDESENIISSTLYATFDTEWEHLQSVYAKYVKAVLNVDKEISEYRYYDSLVQDSKNESTKKVVKELKKLKFAKSTWSKLKTSRKRLSSRLNLTKDPDEVDVFRELALIRFSFPSKIRSEIESDIRNLLDSSSDDLTVDYEDAIAKVTADLLDSVYNSEFDILTSCTSVLWILEFYELIVDSMDRAKVIRSDCHYSLKILYCAALIRYSGAEKLSPKVNELIGDLQRAYKNQGSQGIGIGLSYLYFLIWECLSDNSHFYYNSVQPDELSDDDPKDWCLLQAIRFANEGASKTSMKIVEQQNSKKAISKKLYLQLNYSVNLFIYFTTIGGGPQLFEQIENSNSSNHSDFNVYAYFMAESTRENDYWQYRFNDTLAVMYFRKALFCNNNDLKKEYLKMALRNIDIAVNQSIELNARYSFLKTRILEFLSKEKINLGN